MRTVQIGDHVVAILGNQTKPYCQVCGWPDCMPWCYGSNRKIENPTEIPAEPKFNKWDRVRLSPFGLKSFPNKSTETRGTVVCLGKRRLLRIWFDGNKSVQSYHRDFFEVCA